MDFETLPPSRKAVLALADGAVFVGSPLGAEAPLSSPTVGELVFNTSMTGYQEALTDPSYAGQMLCFSYPLIGNYGCGKHASESDSVHARACIVREWCSHPQHANSRLSLDSYLREAGVPGMAGVDTRAIVKRIRSAGVMPAALAHVPVGGDGQAVERAASELVSHARSFRYEERNYVLEVGTKTPAWEGHGFSKHVALIDCGAKASIARELVGRNVGVRILPPTSEAKEILASDPAGIMVSNGPGDPSQLTSIIGVLRELIAQANRPIFGICLGHQLLGHALGGSTYKLKFGHRGSNHPVQHLESGRVFITAQNHGYAVQNVPERVARSWFVNRYDGSNEGLIHHDLPVFSVQYHPEANPGPYDNSYLFDAFVKLL